MGTFEGAGIGTILLAEAAFELRDGFVFVLFHPLIDFSEDLADAINAVLQWKFKPARRNGKPVAAYLNVEVSFNLR